MMKMLSVTNLSTIILLLGAQLQLPFYAQPNPIYQDNPRPLESTQFESPSLGEACGGVFPVVADATVSNLAPDEPLGTYMNLVVHNNEFFEARALLIFDLEAAIPKGASLLKAELELPVSETGEPYPYRLEAYDLLDEFGEDDVTWNNQPEESLFPFCRTRSAIAWRSSLGRKPTWNKLTPSP